MIGYCLCYIVPVMIFPVSNCVVITIVKSNCTFISHPFPLKLNSQRHFLHFGYAQVDDDIISSFLCMPAVLLPCHGVGQGNVNILQHLQSDR